MIAVVASEPQTHTLEYQAHHRWTPVINVVATTDAVLDTGLLAELRFYVRRCSTARS
jgi:hypothetical protein